jgi:alkanesulfonate monooxygenase
MTLHRIRSDSGWHDSCFFFLKRAQPTLRQYPMEADDMVPPQIEIFSTCPQSATGEKRAYLQDVKDVAQWSERAGFTGMLVYSDNSQVDPWLMSQIIIQNTSQLCPLVAIQPVYMHPFTVAKMVSTLGYLFGRRVYLNLVAGGFKNDLIALNDTTPHDARYSRLTEYAWILKLLLAGNGAVSFGGSFCKVENLRMLPPLDPDLMPGIFVSGSSEAGLAAARALDAVAIHYPEPSSEYSESFAGDSIGHGIRIGIVARPSEETAWKIARQYFPEDRRGQLTQQVAMKVSDSQWHGQLSKLAETSKSNPYWLGPFQNYKTFCPYLVGNYEQVALELSLYLQIGIRTFILDIPRNEEDLIHIKFAFRQAIELFTCQSFCRTG